MPSNLVNKNNSHAFFGSSDQGMITGCEGCVKAPSGKSGIAQARGIVGQKGGSCSGYGFKNSKNIIASPNALASYDVYKKQKGGNNNPLAPTASDFYNQSTAAGYGYKTGADNRMFAGSGYPKISQTTVINDCQSGGKKSRSKKKNNSSRSRKRKNRSRRTRKGGFLCKLIKKRSYTHPKKGQKSRTRKGRKDFITHKAFNRSRHRQYRKRKPYTKKRRNKKNKPRRRRLRGGAYKQFQSNVPLTYTMQTPNGPQGGSWVGQLATPPTYKILNNCKDNYNHYKN